MPTRIQNPDELKKQKKQCTRCGKTKTLNNFYAAPGNKHGRTGSCKKCMRPERNKSQAEHVRKTKQERLAADRRATVQDKQLTEWWLWEPKRFGPLPPWRKKWESTTSMTNKQP